LGVIVQSVFGEKELAFSAGKKYRNGASRTVAASLLLAASGQTKR
jgi:hypothetical protein